MKGFFASRAFAGLVAAIVLAGCSGGSLPVPQNGSVPGIPQRSSGRASAANAGARTPTISLPANLLRERAAHRLSGGRHEARRSVVSPSTQWVVYCARANNDCNVLSPLGTLTATLNSGAGMAEPEGNAIGLISGYWYIANTEANNIPYYKNDGTGTPFTVTGTVALPNPLPDPTSIPAMSP